MSINNIVPSVYSQVRDYMDYVPAQPSSKAVVGMICEKGRDNELVLVDRETFLTEFGEPNINYVKDANYAFGPYVAESWLREAQSMYVCRVLPRSATYANAVLRGTVTETPIVSGVNSNVWELDFIYSTNINQKTDKVISSTGGWVDVVTYSDTNDETTQFPLVAFYGVGRGSWYNDIIVNISRHPSALISANYNALNKNYLSGSGLYIVDIYVRQTNTEDFSMNTDVVVDSTYGTVDLSFVSTDYSLVESFEVSFDPTGKDSSGANAFIQNVINSNSNYINCDANEIVLSQIVEQQAILYGGDGSIVVDESDATTTGAVCVFNDTDEFSAGGVSLVAGSEGSTSELYDEVDRSIFDTNGKINTVVCQSLLSKFYLGVLPKCTVNLESPDFDADDDEYVTEVLDTRNTKFDIVLDAGYTNNVKYAMVALAETRKDCIAILDNGSFSSGNRAVRTRQTGGDLFSINSPYAAIYEEYSLVYDPFTGREIYMPPSYHLANIIARSDRDFEVWAPLAGTNRAYVNNIKQLKYEPTFTNRESFMTYQINPIVATANGYAVMSQRTTLRKPSPRQDINVVRLVNYIDRSLKEFCEHYLFEGNNTQTHSKIAGAIKNFLADIKSRGGLRSEANVKVTASETDVKLRRCRVDIYLDPERAIEQIHLYYYVK